MSSPDSNVRRYFTSSPTFFVLASLFVVFGLDVTEYLVYADRLLKYVYFLIVVVLLVLILVRHSVINVRPAHAFLFLGLCTVSVITFFIKIVLNYPHSYASAMLPLVVVALMLGMPNHRSYVDYRFLQVFLIMTGVIFSTVHVGWQFLTDPGFANLPFSGSTHEKTFVLIFTLYLALFTNRWVLFLYMAVLVALSMWLRPTSTMAAAFLVSIPIAVLFRVGATKVASWLALLCFGLIAVYPVLFVLLPDAAATLIEIEGPIKEFFDVRSNYEFRIALMTAARTEFLEGSVLLGKRFLGTPTVDTGLWSETIHNDFMILLTQGGFVGYFMFVGALVGVFKCAAQGVHMGVKSHDDSIRAFYQIVCVSVVLISVYISFNPMMQKYTVVYFFWFIFLVSGIGWRELHAVTHGQIAESELVRIKQDVVD